MNHPVPPYGIVQPAAKTSSSKAIIICISILVVVIIIIALAVGLGVGLGVGLSKNDDDSSSSSSSGSTSSNTYSILSAPTVSCTYGGSSTCGCSATNPTFLSPRIYQGYTTVSNSWPWVVALYINNGQVFCGGFLISYQYVVTAAHCVNGITASTVTVYAGVQQLSSKSSGQSRVVANITVHPSYSESDYANDIAVLRLVSAFDQTSTVGQCCLSSDTSLPTVGEHAVIVGWGYTSANSGVSNNLQQAVIQVQTFATCRTSGTSDLRICAGYNGTDSCYGDSGSPFMTSVNNSWTCTGLVSSGIGCGTNGVYTRLTAYRSFINGIVNS